MTFSQATLYNLDVIHIGRETVVSTISEIREILPLEEAGNDIYDFTELLSFCPHCKSVQPLMFSRGKLVGQYKYRQQNGFIYHNCGSDRPCHLYY